ncbi:hypothetical protein CULCFH20161_19290 [Corynebacterium ulcerans]|nr:hypothetical protein CULC0211_19320 [Corynebacterium ulcerans]BBJ75102.1 hypothetical protein CULCFH20161_19290 [Corynebacterium ulcerans]
MPTKGEFWHVGGVQVQAAGLSIFVEISDVHFSS